MWLFLVAAQPRTLQTNHPLLFSLFLSPKPQYIETDELLRQFRHSGWVWKVSRIKEWWVLRNRIELCRGREGRAGTARLSVSNVRPVWGGAWGVGEEYQWTKLLISVIFCSALVLAAKFCLPLKVSRQVQVPGHIWGGEIPRWSYICRAAGIWLEAAGVTAGAGRWCSFLVNS